MKNVIYLIVVSFIIGCSSKEETLKTTDDDWTLSIDSIMNANYLLNEPGAAIIITKDGKEIYAKGFGMANLELGVSMTSKMIFRLGSITKQFTAVSILMLEEQGKLNLKDDIRKHLASYPTHEKVITIENLLTHTSGIPSFTSFPNSLEIEQTKLTTTEILDLFKDKPLEFEPGERFSYSNSGYDVLGAIIESVSGMTYEEFVETEIFEKLGMHNSCYDHPEEIIKNKILGYDKDSLGYKRANYMTMCAPFSAGGLRSNVGDLAIWNKAIHEGQLISVENLTRAFIPFKLNSGELSNYGFGWSSNSFLGHQLYHHDGGIFGFSTIGFYFPMEDIYIAILSNNTSSNPGYLNFFISSIILDEKINGSVKIDTNKIDEYSGTYEYNDNTILITSDSSGLLIELPWQKGNLRSTGTSDFYIDGTIISCAFNPDSTGLVESITIKHRFFGDEWITAVRSTEK
jgi:CubicO group peptidase (beta-lactamase class C family)